MRPILEDHRVRLRQNAARLVTTAAAFGDAQEAGQMLDQAIATMARERVLARRTELR